MRFSLEHVAGSPFDKLRTSGGENPLVVSLSRYAAAFGLTNREPLDMDERRESEDPGNSCAATL